MTLLTRFIAKTHIGASAGIALVTAVCLHIPVRGAPLADPKPAAKPAFNGIELGPGILDAVKQPKRIDDWSQREIDAYYQVLDHARKTDHAQQRAKARENFLAELQRLQEKVEEDYRQRIAAIEKKQDELGTVKTLRLKSFAAQNRRKRLNGLENYRENPDEFPLIERVITSLIAEENSRFHGKLVTLHGRLRKLISYSAHENPYGVTQLYEAWIYPTTSGRFSKKDARTNPVVVVCTSIPEGIPQGEDIAESVTITGYVFRLHHYPVKGDKVLITPMILASRLEWHPRTEPDEPPPWIGAALIAAVVLLIALVVLVGRRDKAEHRRQIDRMMHDEEESPTSPPAEGD